MMLLGIVFHAALSYTSTPANALWPLRDASTSTSLSVLVSILSSFRMPVFFVVAGFFFCLLQDRKGIHKAIQDRTRRIAVPLLVLLPIMFALCGYGFIWGTQQSLTPQSPTIDFDWRQLYHLWFLYFLLFFYVVSAVLSHSIGQFNRRIPLKSERTFFMGIATWALLLSLFMWMASPLELGASITFIPHIDPLFFYSIFFLTGYWLYYQRAWLPVLATRFWWIFSVSLIILAVGLAGLSIFRPSMKDLTWFEWVPLSAAQLGFYFTIIAAYLRWGKNGSWVSHYLSSASYWVYIVHLPLVIWFCNLLAPLDAHAYIKLLLNMTLTVLASLLSYHLFVRNTWLGHWLNGKKQPPTAHSGVQQAPGLA